MAQGRSTKSSYQLPTENMPQEANMSVYGPVMVKSNVPLTSSYEYEPLPSKTHIRLMILNHGTGEDILVGSIKTVDIDASDLDSFEAISYVWGSDEKDQSIFIDGKPLPITTSLREALIQARLPERPRTLWADSICINQDDIIEKGHQVFAMGRIYRASHRTLICLGLEPHNAHKARNAAALINDVEAMIEAVVEDPAFSGECNSFPWTSENDPLVVDARWLSAWESLVHHPWFQRGWVVQEAALGSDAVIHWAGAHIEWMSLLKIDTWLYYRAIPLARPEQEPPSYIESLHSDIFHLRRRKEARVFVPENLDSIIQATTTLSILQNARIMKLTDPRDRIYAFMALETTDGVMARLNLQPDYARPHQEVFYEFAVKYLEVTSDLDILTHVDREEEGPTSLNGVPSWAPQWDNGANALPFHVHDSSCQTYALRNQRLEIASIIDGSKLRLRGLLIGPVRCTSRRIVKNLEDPIAEVLALWREVTAEIIKRPGLGFEFIDAVCLGRCRGEFAQWKEAEKEFARYLELNDEVDQLRQFTQDPQIYRDAYRVSLLAINLSENRRVVFLEQGFVGVTPAAAREGDLCALISGLCTPLILRPVSGKPDHYILVGNAYVVRGMFVVDGEVYTQRLDEDHEDWIEEYLPAQSIILV